MQVVGVDIWKGAWVAVVVRDDRVERALTGARIEHVLAAVPEADVIAIDVPIGLPRWGTTRPADVEARKQVGRLHASVFPTPPRELLALSTAREANDVARASSLPGISAQAFSLRRAILEVEPVAASDDRIYEVHPEVSFSFAAGAPLRWSKSTWNGHSFRRGLLHQVGLDLPDDLGSAGEAGVTDIIDAAICAWSAVRIAAHDAVRLPAGEGRAPAIWG